MSYQERLTQKLSSPASRLCGAAHRLNERTLEIDTLYTIVLNDPRADSGVRYITVVAETLSMMYAKARWAEGKICVGINWGSRPN